MRKVRVVTYTSGPTPEVLFPKSVMTMQVTKFRLTLVETEQAKGMLVITTNVGKFRDMLD